MVSKFNPPLNIDVGITFCSALLYKTLNPLMFDVIDDKPEGVARGVYHV